MYNTCYIRGILLESRAELENMGFLNRQQNTKLLAAFQYDIVRVIQELLDRPSS